MAVDFQSVRHHEYVSSEQSCSWFTSPFTSTVQVKETLLGRETLYFRMQTQSWREFMVVHHHSNYFFTHFSCTVSFEDLLSNEISFPTCTGVHQVTMVTPPSLAACVENVTAVATLTLQCLSHVTAWQEPATSALTTQTESTVRDVDLATLALLEMATVGVSWNLSLL